MHFSKLDDSPMFRKQLQALEESADSLKDRCLKFYKGCRKYTEQLGEAYDGDIAFASALESFGGGFDDPIYAAVGGPVTTKFAIALREISTYKEILRSQVELTLNDQLIQFASLDLQDIKEVRKRFDKASVHYDQAREKFLSLKKGTKVDVISEIEEDLRNSRSTFEQARFNLVTCLSNIEAKKKFEFLESVSRTMDAHLRYFKQGYELLHQMEPYIHEVLTYAQQCREQATYEQAALAEQMQDFRQQIERDNQRSFSDIEASPSGDGIHAVGRSSHKMIEALMQSASNGKVQTIKQGYLLKRSSSLRGDWKRRFFVLDSRGRLYYYHKHWGSSTVGTTQEKCHSRGSEHNGLLSRFRSSNHGSPQADKAVLHHTVNLLTATIKLDAEQTDLRFCFRIISPSKNYSLQAESAIDRMDWIDKITGVIASLLNSQSSDQPNYSNRLLDSPVRSSYRCTASDCSSLTSSCELDPTSWDESRGPRPQFRNPRDRPMRGPFSSSEEQMERPIDVLRCVPGNEVCADCNSSDPDWASLNLGVLLCIECSGVHRNLGVHISKVRSLTLDVKVWEPSVITLFQSLGNQFCNSIWEGLVFEQHNEARMLNNCSDVALDSSIEKRKPAARDSFIVKERYIQSKYVEKLFIPKSENEIDMSAVHNKIWNAVETCNKKLVYHLLVSSGADVNVTFDQAMGRNASTHTPNNMSRTQGSVVSGFSSLSSASKRDEGLSHSGEMVPSVKVGHSTSYPDDGGSTLLHLACQNGDIAMVELLIQYGAHVNAVDSLGQTPLHRCALHGRTLCAKLLLSRGGVGAVVDKLGKTALQTAIESTKDNELISLLS